jgi:membrane protease YdiL (CAAX protease family)
LNHFGFFYLVYGWKSPVNFDSMNSNEKTQISLWITPLIFPLDLATVFLLFRIGSGTQAHELGLSIHRPRENLALACVSWLAVTPVVFGISYLATVAHFGLTGSKPQPHPFALLAEESPTLFNGILIGVSTLLVAPVWEELMFRRVLQSWLTQREWGGLLGIGLSFIIGLSAVITGFKDFHDSDLKLVVAKLSPILFTLLMLPGYFYGDRFLKKWIPDQKVFRGIFATALLFGMVHSITWPTPIALFVLGLGLGFLAYGTQTLMAPILFHSLFNAVACLTLVLPHAFPDWPKGSEETSALTRSVPTATCTRVPGSWQLRCK